MKTIFFGDAARDSGSLGFSDAWPLEMLARSHLLSAQSNSPSGPHGVYVHALGNINNKLDVCIVVVICATGHFDVVVGHSDVIGVGSQIFGGGHDCELNGLFVAKRLVGPFPYRSNLLDGSDTVVGNQYLLKVPLAGVWPEFV